MTVRLTNVNLRSSTSPLPLGVNQPADYLGFLGLLLHFVQHFHNCFTDGNRKKRGGIRGLYPRFCAAHHLQLSDRCCIRLLQIRSVARNVNENLQSFSLCVHKHAKLHSDRTHHCCLRLVPVGWRCVWCLRAAVKESGLLKSFLST